MKADTALGFALLGLLHQAPRSGYDLRKIFTVTPFSHFSDSPGAIYPALRRLARRGWVAAGAPSGGRRRQEFRLTSAGRRAWAGWLRKPPTRAEVAWGMDELMVRFAFMSEVVGAVVAVRFLEALERELDGHVAELLRYRKGVLEALTPTGRLAFEAGIEAYRAHVRWARRARARLAKEGGRP